MHSEFVYCTDMVEQNLTHYHTYVLQVARQNAREIKCSCTGRGLGQSVGQNGIGGAHDANHRISLAL